MIFGPPFLFQISNHVQSSRRCCLVTQKFAHLFDACKADGAALRVNRTLSGMKSRRKDLKIPVCRPK